MSIRYILNYSMLPANEAEEVIERVSRAALFTSRNDQMKLFSFHLESGNPDALGIPKCCGLRKASLFDPD